MNSLEEKYLEITNYYFRWMEDVQKFEDEMKAFETETNVFQSKLKDLFKEFVILSSESSNQSGGVDNAHYINFMSAASMFSNNMTEYFNKKIEFEHLQKEFFDKLVSLKKELGLEFIEMLIDKFVSIEDFYIPKINSMLDAFKDKLPLLRQEYNNLKSEYNKFIQ